MALGREGKAGAGGDCVVGGGYGGCACERVGECVWGE
jgi:hypothetical protein